jgi:hypothetical protein
VGWDKFGCGMEYGKVKFKMEYGKVKFKMAYGKVKFKMEKPSRHTNLRWNMGKSNLNE